MKRARAETCVELPLKRHHGCNVPSPEDINSERVRALHSRVEVLTRAVSVEIANIRNEIRETRELFFKESARVNSILDRLCLKLLLTDTK
jgi:hypothetical protein